MAYDRKADITSRLVGCALLAIVGLCLFRSCLDVLMFVACMYCLAFVLAELGVWLGVIDRIDKK
jgi:hypothetical protein